MLFDLQEYHPGVESEQEHHPEVDFAQESHPGVESEQEYHPDVESAQEYHPHIESDGGMEEQRVGGSELYSEEYVDEDELFTMY